MSFSCILRRLLTLTLGAVPILAGFQDFGIPASDSTVDVKAFNVANFTLNNLTHVFVHPVLPGRETITLPMHAFLVEHQSSQKTFMFDLGMRNDPQNLTPAFAEFFSSGAITVGNFKDITELLQDGGISLDSIDMVFWSHGHFDHIGDMSKFPNSTQIVVSSKTNLTIFPVSSASDLQASDLDGHEVSTLDFDNANLTISGMPAIDYFGDGSFYLLDTPGHLTGHMTALARVTPTSFILLGADALHHAGELRPHGNFETNFPCPGDLLDAARDAISTDFFWSSNSTPGAFDLPSRAQPLFAVSDTTDSFYVDPVEATVSIDKIAALDADADFFVLFSHDLSITAILPYFPASLSGWQVEGLKPSSVWLFVDPANPAFLFSPV
ncbi:beta-lactamase-like protein [Mycena maculata]|uniref:Beta-lactamase-like protein n=1 Tax=Mycena maculata TaxID=230809 RepID=A0AAD7HED7_9AGAR|nr:beta-lactamase-like protein [Mycena maculata]